MIIIYVSPVVLIIWLAVSVWIDDEDPRPWDLRKD